MQPQERNTSTVREAIRYMTAKDVSEAAANETLPKWARKLYAEDERNWTAFVSKVSRLLGHLIAQRIPITEARTAYRSGKTADAFAAEVAAREPVGAAVHALKADAVASATKRATETVERVRKALSEGGWDVNAVAPYPYNLNSWSEEYRKAKARASLYGSLVEDAPGARNLHGMKTPRIVIISDKAVAHFIARAEADAATEYDAFICKLVAKTAEGAKITGADLLGSHVWDHSILTITRADGSSERWSTKQIWNVSKLGNHFPQWPSRKIK